MKNILLTLFGLLLLTQTYGQRLEVSAMAYSGLFNYIGDGATGFAVFPGGGPPYKVVGWGTNELGSNLAFSYGAGAQVQYVAKMGFIAGLQAAYEILRSDENLVTGDEAGDGGPTIGHFFLETRYINFNPYLGYRIAGNHIKIDLMPGIEIGLDAKQRGYGSAFFNGHAYQINTGFSRTENDVRARFGITTWYKRIGLAASYAHGLTNYTPGNYPSPGNTYSEVIRIGLCYRIL
jgi:hypothetical protein